MIHSCNSIKNQGQPCLACAYGVDDSIANGLTPNYAMIALATLVVGGSVALYLYNKDNKKKPSGSSDTNTLLYHNKDQLSLAVKPPITEVIPDTSILMYSNDPEKEDGLIAGSINPIITGNLPPLTLDGTLIYRYVPSTDMQYTQNVKSLDKADVIGDLTILPTKDGYAPSTIPVIITPRLGLASDIQSGSSDVISPPGLGRLRVNNGGEPPRSEEYLGRIRTSADNRRYLASRLLGPGGTDVSQYNDDDIQAFLQRNLYSGENEVIAIASARLALSACNRASRYWAKRAQDAGNPNGYVKTLNPLDCQRIAAAIYWAFAQSFVDQRPEDDMYRDRPLSSVNSRDIMTTGIESFALRLKYDRRKLYQKFPTDSGLYPDFLKFLHMYYAFANGIFNCETPYSNHIAIPLTADEVQKIPGGEYIWSINHGNIATRTVNQRDLHVSSIAGVYFFDNPML